MRTRDELVAIGVKVCLDRMGKAWQSDAAAAAAVGAVLDAIDEDRQGRLGQYNIRTLHELVAIGTSEYTRAHNAGCGREIALESALRRAVNRCAIERDTAIGELRNRLDWALHTAGAFAALWMRLRVGSSTESARAALDRAEQETLAAVRQRDAAQAELVALRAEHDALTEEYRVACYQRDEAREKIDQMRAQCEEVCELSHKAELRAVVEAEKRQAAEEDAAAYREVAEREELKAFALAEACLAARHAYTTLRKERQP